STSRTYAVAAGLLYSGCPASRQSKERSSIRASTFTATRFAALSEPSLSGLSTHEASPNKSAAKNATAAQRFTRRSLLIDGMEVHAADQLAVLCLDIDAPGPDQRARQSNAAQR